MKVLLVTLLAAGTALAAHVPDYPSPPPTPPGYSGGDAGGYGGGDDYKEGGSNDGYGKDSYSKDSYSKPKCSYVDETVHQEHCEDFTEKVCHTTHKESCKDVKDQNCGGVISSKQVRKCFDVTELKCTLKEDWKMETIQMPVTVQKCKKVPEKVCDTIYDSSISRKDKHQCITVDNSKCSNSQTTVYDRTCRHTFNIDCETTPVYQQPKQDSYGGDSSYGGGDSYGAAQGGYSSQDSYGLPKPNCYRTPEDKCYKTPRQVSVQNCYSVPEKICEKLSENQPSVKPRQSCHMEEKRVCELVKRSQSKQVKKYIYSKQCRNVPRQVCENSDVKTLVPSCVPITRKKCSYTPVYKCEKMPRKKCFNLAYKIRKQKCEKYPEPAYPEPKQDYAPEPSYGQEPAYPEPKQDYAPEPSYPEPAYPEPKQGYEEPDDGY